jgi:hypothetical protein
VRLSRPSFLPAALLLLSACGDDQPATAPAKAGATAADRLLVVDGIAVTFGDLQPWVDYLDTIYANHSARTKMRQTLDEFVLPMALARRAFATERKEQLAKANALRSVADNVVELEAKAGMLRPFRKNVGRRDVELPVSTFLFDPLRTGSVSQPIEVPHGWKVVAARDLQESAIVGDDVADAVIVPFVTHDLHDFTVWYNEQKLEIANRVTWIHPDYRDAVPEWLKLP